MLDYEKLLQDAAQQLVDTIGCLKKAAGIADEAIKKADSEKGVTEKVRSELLTAKEAVEIREKAVEGKEKSILSADALAAQKDVVESQGAYLANAKRAFEKECVLARNEIAQKLSDLAVDRKILDDALLAVAEEKKNYKLKILEEFVKEAGK